MSGPLGIVAGGGQLPLILAQEAARTRSVFLVRLAGFVDEALRSFEGVDRNIGEIGGTLAALRTAGCAQIAFAGAVKRPDMASLKLDAVGQAYLPKLAEAAQRGDDALLATLVAIFVSEGFDVLGAHEVCADLLCPVGLIAGTQPDEPLRRDLAKAHRLARLIGREDIGQGCVVADGLVLALEAQEGTDGMLRRLQDLPEAVRGTAQRRRGVLVKCAKPGQDWRIDLPVVGVETVHAAGDAGLAGIGLEAGSCLIVARTEMEEAAREVGIFVIGLDDVPSLDGS